MLFTSNREKRLATRKYFQMLKEYDKAKAELERMYIALIQQRSIAGLENEAIESPYVYEVPEYTPGRTIERY